MIGFDIDQSERIKMDEDPVEKIRVMRRRLATEGPAHVRSAGDFERVSLPSPDCDILRDLMITEGARTVIEIGLAYGASALAIAEALVTNGLGRERHLIIDAYQNSFQGSGWSTLLQAGATRFCVLLEERSQIVLPRLLTEGLFVDAAFVDGSHIFHNVFVDLFYLRELIRPGGLIVLDDGHYPSVATAVRYFQVNTGWQLEPIASPTRLRAFRLPASRSEPHFESFQAF